MLQVSSGAPEKPFFYYHIPSLTKTVLNVADLLAAAQTRMPQLMGVKFVSDDMNDWFSTVSTYNNSHALMFAPEPKLQSFAVGMGRGTVLAQDFFAPTYLRMHSHFLQGDLPAAQAEQQWKFDVSAVSLCRRACGCMEFVNIWLRLFKKVNFGLREPQILSIPEKSILC